MRHVYLSIVSSEFGEILNSVLTQCKKKSFEMSMGIDLIFGIRYSFWLRKHGAGIL